MSSDLLKDMEREKDSEEIQAQCSPCRDGAPAPTALSSGCALQTSVSQQNTLEQKENLTNKPGVWSCSGGRWSRI